MLIRVRYTDDVYDYVQDSSLDELIRKGRIKQFYRAEAWVTIGEEPVRGMGGAAYDGPERRRAVAA